jgi:hypothetical protein
MQERGAIDNGQVDGGRITAVTGSLGEVLRTRSRLPAGTPPRTFSADETSRYGFRPSMLLAAFSLGLGSTGAAIVHGITRLVRRELGRLPSCYNYLLVDSAAPRPGMDPDHFCRIGVDGAGTLPEEGDRLFRATERYAHLRGVINTLVQGLSAPDPGFPTRNPREALDFWVFAGCGGTSGGALHPAIALLHDVARDRHVREPRIHVVLMGADMPLRDASRRIILEQAQVVPDTAANNLIKICGDLVNPDEIREVRPDGTSFTLKASDRVHSVILADQSNGEADFATTEGLIGMLAHAFFVRLFTQAGTDLMDRFCDQDKLGATGRAS